MDTKIHGCSNPLYKVVDFFFLHRNYTHPPVYFKSVIDYLQFLGQCKHYVNCFYIVLFQE
jgi:hypothetical protein